MATFDHFGASWKAVIRRSLIFEQRQIEDQSWRQNWPIVCALKLCCWVEDLKMNSLGCRLANMKCRNSWQEPENGQNGHFSFFNGSGGFFCPILLIFSPNGLVWPTKQLWRGAIWFFWLHLFINTPYQGKRSFSQRQRKRQKSTVLVPKRVKTFLEWFWLPGHFNWEGVEWFWIIL